MTRITNAEHVLLLLRGHLQRTQRSRRKDAKSASRADSRPSALERVQELAGADALSEPEVERALIGAMLSEEFGAAAANDPAFQQMVGDVLAVIRRDEESHALLQHAVEQLAQPKP